MTENHKKNKKVVILSAHADDHIASAGTLFKLHDKGYELYEIVMTTSNEGRDFRNPEKATVTELRDAELTAASRFLNIEKTFRLAQEDLGLKFSKELVFKVVPILRELQPEIGIIMNSFDWHIDHIETYKIGSEAFKWAATGVKPDLGSAWRTPIVLCVEGMLPIQPNVLVDVTQYAKKKMELWNIYVSQARPQALNFAESLMTVRGYHLRRNGSMLAEAYTTDPTSPVILFDNL